MPLHQFAQKVASPEEKPVKQQNQEVQQAPAAVEKVQLQKKTVEPAVESAEPKPIVSAKSAPFSDRDQETLCALSALQIRYGRPAEAIPYLMMVRKVNPANAECQRLLALAFMRMERWSEADAILSEMSPDTAAEGSESGRLMLLLRSVVSFKNSRVEEARELFGKFRAFMKNATEGSLS